MSAHQTKLDWPSVDSVLTSAYSGIMKIILCLTAVYISLIFKTLPIFASECCEISPCQKICETSSSLKVRSDYYCETYFSSLTELFCGQEVTNGRQIIRTFPACRAGLYFLVTPNCAWPTHDTVEVKLSYQRSDKAQPFEKIFKINLAKDGPKSPLMIGLTGEDWPSASTRLNAWQIEIIGKDGTLLAREQSYAWDNRNQPDFSLSSLF